MTERDAKKVDMLIEGMTCDDCAITLERALSAVPGVERADVSFTTGRARVSTSGGVASEALVQAVDAAGYRASLVGRPVAQAREPRPPQHTRNPDIVVLGGGSAGFAAAIRAAELGAHVALIEGGTLGGTCVNVGCVPSKTLIRAAEVQHRTVHHPFEGVQTTAQQPVLSRLVAQKDRLVLSLRNEKYWDVLKAYPNISLRQGRGSVNEDLSISIEGDVLKPKRLIVATGASPSAPPIAGLTESGYLTSAEALSLTDLPESLIVVGGSAVGLEIAQLYARLGTRVAVLEAAATLVPSEDTDIGSALASYLREEGLDVRTGALIDGVSRTEAGYKVTMRADGRAEALVAEQLLIATGRRANTHGFGLEKTGIELGSKGEIRVNQYLQTSRAEVYAAGDVIGDPMFVYVAAFGGHVAAENALGGNSRPYDLSALPRVTFTDPQVASVGITEAEARRSSKDVMVANLPLSYVPRALAAHETRGFIKLIANRATNRLLGAHILATEAGEMIQEPTLAIRHGISIDDLARAFHPYLTLSEGIKLAAQAFTKDVRKLSCCAA